MAKKAKKRAKKRTARKGSAATKAHLKLDKNWVLPHGYEVKYHVVKKRK